MATAYRFIVKVSIKALCMKARFDTMTKNIFPIIKINEHENFAKYLEISQMYIKKTVLPILTDPNTIFFYKLFTTNRDH